jgi:hypothetical protein
VVRLAEDWEKLCKRGEASENQTGALIQKFRPLVERLMIRFAETSRFLDGSRIVVVPGNKL